MNDLNIIIKALLDEQKSTADINKQLEKMSSKLETLKIKLDIDEKVVTTIDNFNTSIRQVDKILKDYSVSAKHANQDFKAQQQQLESLGVEYGELGNVIKKVTDLTKELQTTSYQKQAGLRYDIRTNADGIIDSAKVTDTTMALGKLIGTYKELQGEETTNIQLTKVLNQLYADREIRELSLDSVTGKWSATIAENAKQNRILHGTLDQATGSLYKQSDALKQIRNVNMGFMEQLKVAISRIPVWMIGMTAFYQTLRFFTNGVKYINDLNASLTEVSIVTGKTQSEVSALGMEYQKLAKSMSLTTKDITQASVTFYRQGLSQAEVMERVKVASQYAKVANVDFAQSSEILTATVNSMGISIERAADVMTYLGDATATESQEIGRAMQKVGGSAAAAG